jgi:hypothetical protein
MYAKDDTIRPMRLLPYILLSVGLAIGSCEEKGTPSVPTHTVTTATSDVKKEEKKPELKISEKLKKKMLKEGITIDFYTQNFEDFSTLFDSTVTQDELIFISAHDEQGGEKIGLVYYQDGKEITQSGVKFIGYQDNNDSIFIFRAPVPLAIKHYFIKQDSTRFVPRQAPL